MPYKPKNPPQSFDNMVDDLTQQTKEKRKIYKAESDENRKVQLSEIAARAADEFIEASRREKIELTALNLDRIAAQINLYLLACSKAGAVASWGGVCRSLGYTRQGCDHFMNTHPGAATTELLTMTKELVSDVLDSAALKNQVNGIVAIFIQKSIYDRRDQKLELVNATPNDPLGTPRSMAEIEAFAAAMPDD